MKRLTLMIALIFAGLYLNAQEDNCVLMFENLGSEKEAIATIENSTFTFSESIRPGTESWMTSANFYSCDHEAGFLIVKCEKKTYIHQEVPTAVWQALKDAKSTGGYYNFYIKNKYKLDKKGANSPLL